MNNFTIIIPIYNESDSIFILVKEIKKEFRGKLPEIIIVDDGSTDSFVSEKKKLTNNIKIISHKNNLGKCMAMMTGVKAANNNVICIIDGDGQNPPYEIKKMIDYWYQVTKNWKSFVLICGNRKKRKETIDLWNKIETFESDEWNKKYYDVSDPLQKAQGAKVEIILNNNDKITDQLDYANAHPKGKTPFVRENYINKMKKLFKNIVEEKEEKRFLNLIDNLSNLNQDEVKRLNVNCKQGFLNLDNNKIEGIY